MLEAHSDQAGQALMQRDALFAQAIVANPSYFESVLNSGYQDYLDSGAKAIQEERAALLGKFYK